MLEPILVSKGPGGHLNYLVLTDGGVFNLTMVREQEAAAFCKSRWILKHRVNDDIPGKTESSQEIPISPK